MDILLVSLLCWHFISTPLEPSPQILDDLVASFNISSYKPSRCFTDCFFIRHMTSGLAHANTTKTRPRQAIALHPSCEHTGDDFSSFLTDRSTCSLVLPTCSVRHRVISFVGWDFWSSFGSLWRPRTSPTFLLTYPYDMPKFSRTYILEGRVTRLVNTTSKGWVMSAYSPRSHKDKNDPFHNR